MTRHYNITVKGKVHGVSYRFCTHMEALRLDLTGYIKNLPNGNVFIEAEGTEENINKLISWCYTGSPMAKVSEVIAEEGEVKGFPNFEIKR